MSAQYLLSTTCANGCCSLITKPFIDDNYVYDFRHKYRKFKAGVFFYDPNTQKVLLVQSRGMKWGPPKGTIEEYESIVQCAIREVKEETGLVVHESQLIEPHRIDRATYFYIELPETTLTIPGGHDNDASGIAWINIECLEKLHDTNSIDLNSHCKKLIKKILKINLKK